MRTSANLIGESVTVLARANSFRDHPFHTGFDYYTDLELWLRIAQGGSVGFLGKPLSSFRVHRGACSWGQRGLAYHEFLSLEAQFPRFALAGKIERGLDKGLYLQSLQMMNCYEQTI